MHTHFSLHLKFTLHTDIKHSYKYFATNEKSMNNSLSNGASPPF